MVREAGVRGPAIALQRIGFGLVLIVAFSLGLAGVLTAIGVVWVHAGRLFDRIPAQRRLFGNVPIRGRLLQALPAASALFITLIGIGITLQALIQAGALLRFVDCKFHCSFSSFIQFPGATLWVCWLTHSPRSPTAPTTKLRQRWPGQPVLTLNGQDRMRNYHA